VEPKSNAETVSRIKQAVKKALRPSLAAGDADFSLRQVHILPFAPETTQPVILATITGYGENADNCRQFE